MGFDESTSLEALAQHHNVQDAIESIIKQEHKQEDKGIIVNFITLFNIYNN